MSVIFDVERAAERDESIGVTFDGELAVLDFGAQADILIPFKGRIQSVHVQADRVGNITIDIWKTSFATFPPAGTQSIVGTNPPKIVSGQTYEDLVLTGWTTLVEKNSTLFFVITDIATIQHVVLVLKMMKL